MDSAAAEGMCGSPASNPSSIELLAHCLDSGVMPGGVGEKEGEDKGLQEVVWRIVSGVTCVRPHRGSEPTIGLQSHLGQPALVSPEDMAIRTVYNVPPHTHTFPIVTQQYDHIQEPRFRPIGRRCASGPRRQFSSSRRVLPQHN